MSSSEIVQRFKRLLAIGEPTTQLVRRIEGFAWAKPWWEFQADRHDRVLDELLDRTDDLAIRREFNCVDVLSMAAHDRVKYTRKLIGKMPEIRTQLEDGRFSDNDIRDVMVGRLVRKNRQPSLASWRRNLIFVLGLVWHFVATVSIGLLTLLVLFLPGHLMAKILVLATLLIFYLGCFGIMHSVCFRAVSMWDRYRDFAKSNNDIGSRSTL